jgi:hypothetical protein
MKPLQDNYTNLILLILPLTCCASFLIISINLNAGPYQTGMFLITAV